MALFGAGGVVRSLFERAPGRWMSIRTDWIQGRLRMVIHCGEVRASSLPHPCLMPPWHSVLVDLGIDGRYGDMRTPS